MFIAWLTFFASGKSVSDWTPPPPGAYWATDYWSAAYWSAGYWEE